MMDRSVGCIYLGSIYAVRLWFACDFDYLVKNIWKHEYSGTKILL
jgi:hypothetical protein